MSTVRRSAVGRFIGAFAVATATLAAPALAADCGNDGAGFDAWLGRFKGRAAAQGITAQTIAIGLREASYDPNIIRLDRNQKSFKLTFEEFYARRVSTSLINRGRRLMATHKATLDRVEARYGVPAAVLVSIWGLETNYGADGGGGRSIVRSIATLAYDCRRTDFFQDQLMSVLKIIQRGDIPVEMLRGGWAGEIGQVQFLPTPYFKYAVDFDGDGSRDLFRSVPDMMASVANFLKSHGWQPRQPWGEGTANYNVIRDWNKAEVYVKTIATMSARMGEAGPPPPAAPRAPRPAKT
ncbi:MAG TPA: lytic murein transglycosylase, partial [Hyphomicrobiaceae bacterium]|nr:lytic murein transglycosylase [Hyphomicrobiaceae bacterium]